MGLLNKPRMGRTYIAASHLRSPRIRADFEPVYARILLGTTAWNEESMLMGCMRRLAGRRFGRCSCQGGLNAARVTKEFLCFCSICFTSIEFWDSVECRGLTIFKVRKLEGEKRAWKFVL